MATFSIIGNELIDPDELKTKKFSGELDTVSKIKDLHTSDKILKFTDVSIPVNTLPEISSALRSDFKPIGIGKPLSVEIATVYTGEYKRLLGKKDVIVVSGIKNAQSYKASSRAINIKAKNAEQNSYLKFTAFSEGTPYVFYSPAMDNDKADVSFEIMFDNFNGKFLDDIGNLLTYAAGVPVFLPAAPYLLGGGQLMKVSSRLGENLFSGSPSLSGNIQIEFNSPVIPSTVAKEFIVYNDKDKQEFKNLQLAYFKDSAPHLRLVDRSSKSEYQGYAPYIIVLLNGAKKENLENFSPTLAAASVIKQFYGNENSEVVDTLKDAMKLYNDFTYKMKGEKLKKEMQGIPPESDDYKKLKTLYDAYNTNIQSEEFKLEKS